MQNQKIRVLLDDIKLGRIALPEFQRDYVWKPGGAKDLIDSLYKEFPIGMILLWKPSQITIHNPLQGQDAENLNPDSVILDGQQRLTSMMKIESGEIKIYTEDQNSVKMPCPWQETT